MIKFRWTLRETVVEGWESAEVSKAWYIFVTSATYAVTIVLSLPPNQADRLGQGGDLKHTMLLLWWGIPCNQSCSQKR